MTKTASPAATGQAPLDELCINTIRTLAIDAVEKANSGHPGMPMGAAPMAYVLWTRFLRHNPHNPLWPDRDRFVLSAGHGSMLLYALLHLTGYDLSLDDIKHFRQWGSRTPGHPEHGHTPGVEATTGPLGQGFGNGVGMAMAEHWLAAYFNRPGHTIVDHYTYAIASDGDMMEGVSSESASLAAHLRLGKLIYFYDDNHITIEGNTDLAFSEDVGKRFEAYGWHVEHVDDGNDLDAITQALTRSRAESERPSLIRVRTHIGYGSPHKQDSAEAHGSALGAEEVKLTKQNLGWPVEPAFLVPNEALAHFREAVQQGEDWQKAWQRRFDAYAKEYPDLAAQWQQFLDGTLPAGWDRLLAELQFTEGVATRQASGKVINAIAATVPNLIGGAADLAPSTDTLIKNAKDFETVPGGRNMHFGIREHSMGATCNGMALHGGIRPFGSTFLIFSDYMRPSMRVAALTHLPVIYVFTHDSIGLGEDGPTHQPIEHLASLRAMPHMTVIRPGDATETVIAWKLALERRNGPTALILTRQKLPIIDRRVYAPAEMVAKGGYVLADAQAKPARLILIATGSEVSLILAAKKKLEEQGIGTRVVSMPSWEIFDEQPSAYRNEVLPQSISVRLSVEAGSPQGWLKYVGDHGDSIGMTDFGASAPGGTVMEKFGFTADNVVARALALLK